MEKNNSGQVFQEFYLAVKIKDKNDFVVYTSDEYKLSEIDIINLIKICILEARSKIIGRKILSVYEDSTNDRKEITKERLKKIGLEKKENEKPETIAKRNTTVK